MEIIYIANIRLPTEKAHGHQIMETCQALAATGAHVELWVPWRRNPLRGDPFAFYNVSRNFTVRRLPAIDLVWLGWAERLAFMLETVSFTLSTRLRLWFVPRTAILYGRDEYVLA